MKRKALLIIFILVIIFSVSAQEQEKPAVKERSFSFQANPLYLLGDLMFLLINDNYGSYNIAFEFEFLYAINKYFNISINPMLFLDKSVYGWYANGDTVYRNITHIIVTPGLLFRPAGSGLKGLYMGVNIPVGFANRMDTGDYGLGRSSLYYDMESNDNFFIMGIGASAGYQMIFKKGFTLSYGIGVQRTWPIGPGNTENYYDPFYWLNIWRFPFRIGYSF